MRAPLALHLHHVSLAEYESAQWGDALGVASFNGSGASKSPAAGRAGIPIARVNTPVLPDAGSSASCGGAVSRPHLASMSGCASGAAVRCCSATLPSPRRGRRRTATATRHCRQATAQAYREIFATLAAESYPHLLCIWNYLPAINRGTVPAASALGCPSASPLMVYFLAGRIAPTFVENPRQVSAYHNPREYGSHRPAFSGATLLRQSTGLALFISGTASIVGHRSLHLGDTAANIEALLAQANRATSGARFELSALACKVYVRRSADLPLVQAELDGALGGDARIMYLQADICRHDLPVEIEAAAMYPCAA